MEWVNVQAHLFFSLDVLVNDGDKTPSFYESPSLYGIAGEARKWLLSILLLQLQDWQLVACCKNTKISSQKQQHTDVSQQQHTHMNK